MAHFKFYCHFHFPLLFECLKLLIWWILLSWEQIDGQKYEKRREKVEGPTEIWTRIARFRVWSANHYTMGPFTKCSNFVIWIMNYWDLHQFPFQYLSYGVYAKVKEDVQQREGTSEGNAEYVTNFNTGFNNWFWSANHYTMGSLKPLSIFFMSILNYWELHQFPFQYLISYGIYAKIREECTAVPMNFRRKCWIWNKFQHWFFPTDKSGIKRWPMLW